MDQQLLDKLTDLATQLKESKNEILDKHVASYTDPTKKALVREIMDQCVTSFMDPLTTATIMYHLPQEEILTKFKSIVNEIVPTAIAFAREGTRLGREFREANKPDEKNGQSN